MFYKVVPRKLEPFQNADAHMMIIRGIVNFIAPCIGSEYKCIAALYR